MAGLGAYLHQWCNQHMVSLFSLSGIAFCSLASSKTPTPSPPNTKPRGKEDPMPLPQRLVFLPMGLSRSLAYSELITRPDNEDAIVLDLWGKIHPWNNEQSPIWSTQTEDGEGMGLQEKHENIDERKGKRF